MKKMIVPICLMLITIAFPLAADADFWLNLTGEDPESIENLFGPDYVEIPPASIDSRAVRIIWYDSGLTFWFEEDGVSMVRADASAGGEIEGLYGGMRSAEIESIFGRAWIESEGSLYYNLPWKSGPRRLRFVFGDGGLEEIYLYRVR